MINLLPPEEKRKLLTIKKRKLAIIFGIVVVVCLVCIALILSSIEFYILADTNYQKSILDQTKSESMTPDFVSLSKTLQNYNRILSQLDSFYKKEIYFGDALDTIKNIPEPKGLYLTSISLIRDSRGIAKVSVSGVSDTRDNLLLFRQNVESDKEVKNSSFSNESWINPINANFSLTFEISPTK